MRFAEVPHPPATLTLALFRPTPGRAQNYVSESLLRWVRKGAAKVKRRSRQGTAKVKRWYRQGKAKVAETVSKDVKPRRPAFKPIIQYVKQRPPMHNRRR